MKKACISAFGLFLSIKTAKLIFWKIWMTVYVLWKRIYCFKKNFQILRPSKWISYYQIFKLSAKLEKLPPCGRLFSSSCRELQPLATTVGLFGPNQKCWKIYFRNFFYSNFFSGNFFSAKKNLVNYYFFWIFFPQIVFVIFFFRIFFPRFFFLQLMNFLRKFFFSNFFFRITLHGNFFW